MCGKALAILAAHFLVPRGRIGMQDLIIRRAVGRVIEAIRDDVGEQHSVDEMARTAMFSKFHFSRIFQRLTGISPGRFLMVMRLHRAKQLLLSTSLSITEITHEVGYASVGTFSSRFSSSVGVSPSTYRRLGGVNPRIPVDDRWGVPPAAATIQGDIRADIALEDNALRHNGTVFVGLFPDPVPLGMPARCAMLDRLGPYTLENVPAGTWYVLAYSGSCTRVRQSPGDPAPLVGSHGPFTIEPGAGVIQADIPLRPMNAFDPPVLLALPNL
jgi:AraC-like DNA-binding protein